VKIAAQFTSYGLKVDRYRWSDDAPAKADWGWWEDQEELLETIVAAGLAFEEKPKGIHSSAGRKLISPIFKLFVLPSSTPAT